MRRLLSEMMSSYLEELQGQKQQSFEVPLMGSTSNSNSLPISPHKEKWLLDRDERCLTRNYQFDSHSRMCDFVRELLDHDASCGHYGKILCDFPVVNVSVKTHDVDDVTELDKDYATQCENIYEDVTHYGYNETEDDVY